MKQKLEDTEEENKERRKINIDDRKLIESLETEIKRLKIENHDLQDVKFIFSYEN